MAEDKNKKPEELNDELLDEVSGGMLQIDFINKPFSNLHEL